MKKITDNYIREYVRKKFGKELEKALGGALPEKNIKKMKDAMKEYGNNHWWESSDLIHLAMYQIFEKILLVKTDEVHKGIEMLFNRPVQAYEFGNIESIRDKVRDVITSTPRYKKYLPLFS